MAAISHLDALNPDQRRAVEHGVAVDGHVGTPLLVIAGAGSGKTNTLAHRVAHLIVNGADPRRIMLLTFSRRAAAEMMRRVERIVANVMHEGATAMTDAIVWAGTFSRSWCAPPPRVCRRHWARPSLHNSRSRGFRRSDESRSPRPRFLQDEEALSYEGHLPCDLLAHGQCRASVRRRARLVFSVVRGLGGRAAKAVCRLCRGEAAAACARLR